MRCGAVQASWSWSGTAGQGQVPKAGPLMVAWARLLFVTPPEVTNTGPGFNRGSGGGARGCGFEERVGVHARTGGIHFL